jgi:hypothetical protein
MQQQLKDEEQLRLIIEKSLKISPSKLALRIEDV